MDLNPAALNAAHISFDAAWAAAEGKPNTMERVGMLNDAILAYEQERRAQVRKLILDMGILRGNFERWAQVEGLSIVQGSSGNYFMDSTRCAWKGYRACAIKLASVTQ